MIRYVVAILAACTPIETGLTFALDSDCTAPGVMNTYAVTLFTIDGISQGTRCDTCVSSGMCKQVSTVCTCTEDRMASSMLIADAVQKVRFADVDPAAEYCVRVLALDEPTTSPCTCPADLADVTTGRVCLLSRVGTISEANAPIAISQAACQGTMGYVACTAH